MIGKIPDQILVQTGEWRGTTFDIIPKETFGMACRKINELADVVNRLEESVQGVVNNSIADGGRIQGLKEKLDAVVNMVNIHEGEIDKLQMKVEPEKCKTPADPYAEQRKWIGKLCKFWDNDGEGYIYEILIDIEDDGSDYPYKIVETDCKNWTLSYKHCEPVSEDLIYKGE